MKLLEKIKTDYIDYRFKRESIKVKVLSTFLGDVDKALKSGKPFIESDLIALLKKYVENNNEVLKLKQVSDLEEENLLLSSYLPKQLSSADMNNIIKENALTDLPSIMKYFKTNFAGRYDGKLLSNIATKR